MSRAVLSDEQKLDWLQLARTPRIGPVTFQQLLKRFQTPAAALEALPTLTQKRTSPKPPSRSKVEDEYRRLKNYGGQLLCSGEADYPHLLMALQAPPPILTALGNTQLNTRKAVAIVGARDASATGRKIARELSAQLSEDGFVIVSGLARGIDGEAHAASLAGGTIAVLGGGLDHIYPPQHDRLYAAIAAEGLIISESPFGYRAQARDFPRRNRIITGLASGVIVIEAAERSGSLISARTAGEQGREVMAIPGSPLDPRAAGTNRLLREGATLVRNADDVIEALSAIVGSGMSATPLPDFEDAADNDAIPETQLDAVRAALSPSPMTIDELARAAAIGSARCAAILVELELSGEAITLAGGLACRAY